VRRYHKDMALAGSKRPLSGTLPPRTGWRVAFLWALLFAVIGAAYVSSLDGTLVSLVSIGKVLAFTATLLFAMALGASSVSYYTGFPDMRLGYQKYLGVLAFWIALLYSITLLLGDPDRYFYGFFDNLFTVDVLFGLVAMCIFGSMVFINTKPVASLVGRRAIFFCFGLGFVAYALLVMRAIWIEWDLWMQWFSVQERLPPPRIILSIIATSVLLLRVSVALKKRARKRT